MAQRAGCTFLALWAFFLAGPAARAEDREERYFSIFVDGKEAGQSRLQLVQQKDGSAYMSATAKVEIKGFFSYSWNIDAEEWWKDGKLVALKARSVEKGKQTDVAIGNDGKQLVLNVNGQLRNLGPEVWTTSYWKLADARFHNNKVPVVETDTGKDFVGQLRFIDNEQLTIGGKLQKCFHFRVEGPVPTDLWFDEYHRLVRQEFTEAGHRTIVQLNSIRR